MSRSRALSCLLCVLSMWLVQVSDVRAQEGKRDREFVSLFDGKSLEGWSGDEKFWHVADGAIVAESTSENPCTENTFLTWSLGEVDDFELRLKFRITGTDSANSGVQIRGSVREDGHVIGYQADIDQAWTVGRCPV